MSRRAIRSKTRRSSREKTRQTVAVVVWGIALALGAVATDEIVTVQREATEAAAEVAAKAAMPSDDEIYTGSILFTPIVGRTCRQLLFDNRTGRISDNGNVDCERAEYGGPKNFPVSRARAISDAFRGH
jgi:hypothetical protein